MLVRVWHFVEISLFTVKKFWGRLGFAGPCIEGLEGRGVSFCSSRFVGLQGRCYKSGGLNLQGRLITGEDKVRYFEWLAV